MSELVERNRRNRNALLCHLYEASGGDIYKRVDMSKFGEKLGLTFKEINQVMIQLIGAGLAQGDGDGGLILRITLPGISQAEALLSTPASSTEYPLVDTTASLQQQLRQHQSNWNWLKEQEARYGLDLYRKNKIEDEETAITRLKKELGIEP